MAKSRINDKLYGLLDSRGYKPDMYDSSGKKVAVPEEAELMQFSFIKDGEDYGRATVTIDGSHRLIIYYNDKIAQSPKAGSMDSQSWEQLMKQLRKFAINYQLGFQRKDVDDLESDMAVRAHSKKEGLAEGYHPMGKKQSYNDVIPETKIIIKHNKQMEEGEQRFRSVDKIFIETAQGERFLAPTNKPGIAQIYARHVAEGGRPSDERWNHINEMCEEYSKMAGFVRATKGKQFNESTEKLVNEGMNHYSKLRECLSKMRGKKGYHAYFESWTPTLHEDEVNEDLSEMFKSSSLDPRIESVMPILSKLSKNIAESKPMAEVIALQDWADNTTESKDDVEDYKDPEEADYGDEYQDTVKRAGEFVKGVDQRAAARKAYKEKEVAEGSDERKQNSLWAQITAHEKAAAKSKDLKKQHHLKMADQLRSKLKTSDNVDEGFDDVVKGVKRVVKGKPSKGERETHHANRALGTAHAIGDVGSTPELDKELNKHVNRFHKVKNVGKGVAEDLDSNQKAAGQLGPVGGPAKKGDLVGASESVDPLASLKRLIK